MSESDNSTRPVPRINGWLETRLRNSFGAHFEASVYGPMNGFLNVFFPISRKFIIKPQGLLRAQVEDEDSPVEDQDSDSDDSEESETYNFQQGFENALANSSSDSYHDVVGKTKGVKGSSIPDFIIVKAGPKNKADILLAIIEVKINAADQLLGRLQICRYLTKASTKTQSHRMAGFLIYDNIVEIYVIPPDDPVSNNTPVSLNPSTWEPEHVTAPDAPLFKEYLNRIAASHWDL